MAYYKKSDRNQPSAEDKALDRFAEMMIEKISGLQQDWKKPWFSESSLLWPKNLSGREYNGMNALMLMMHCEKEGFKLPVFMTFDRMTALNYTKDKQGNVKESKGQDGSSLPKVSVLKGQKSFPVFITTFTVVDKETKEKIKYDDYKKLSDEEKQQYKVYPKLNVYNVFNIDQTNLQSARPELYQKLESENTIKKTETKAGEMFSFPAIDQMIGNNEWICPIKPVYGDQAYYSIAKNEIVVPEKKQFRDGESFYGTTFHEMAHSTGAEAHLNRLKPTHFGSQEYAREELVAELTAALVAQRYGMTKNLKDDSAAYLKNWLENLKESPDFIKSTLTDVKKAAAIITQKVETIQHSIDNVQTIQEEQKPDLREPVTYDIPVWAMPYILYGDAEGMSDEEQELVDKFISEKFPKGFLSEIIEGSDKELNISPAFGTRNENALPHRGESPYQAVDTVSVKFYSPHNLSITETTMTDPVKIAELKQQTVEYALEYTTGNGMHTGISWLRDSFNELAELTAGSSESNSVSHRENVSRSLLAECRSKLSPEQVNELSQKLSEIVNDTNYEHHTSMKR